MDEHESSQRQYDSYGQPIHPSFWQKIKKFLAPIGVGFVVFFKFLVKLKFLLPVLKTGGTMIISIGAYAMFYGWQFAVGFVLLIFVHECGHLIAAKRIGLKVGAPVFIPFMGALIALKEAPRNAWIEAQVGIGGPILGTVGAGICELIYLVTGNLMFRALAYTGFFLNLFNLAPVGFLDGGRIVTALSPWLWLVGFGFWGTFVLVLLPLFILCAVFLLRVAPEAGKGLVVQFLLLGLVYPCVAGLDANHQPLYLNLCALGLLLFTALLLMQRLADDKPQTQSLVSTPKPA